jgi:hypothetical protein
MQLFKDNPNDSPMDGTIHPIGLEQLAGYQRLADAWPRYPDGRAVRCGRCDQSLWFTYDEDGTPYRYSTDETMALTVAHIRQRHAEAINGTD